MRKMSLLPAALVFTALVGLAFHPLSADELKPGDPAPAFELPGSDGKVYKLEDFRDKQAVVLAWFPKAFTGGCTAECKSMKADGKALLAFDVAYFTASCDEPELNKKFAASLEVDYPILSDPGRNVAAAYGVVDDKVRWARRWTFIIGPDGKILAIDKAVKTATHAKDIAAKLAELGVKKRAEEKAEKSE